MQLSLSLPCWYAFARLIEYWNDTFAEYQIFKKYGAETEIEDFDEFVDFFHTVSTARTSELHDEEYVYFDVVTIETHEELVNRLVRAALDINFVKDGYEIRRFKELRQKYEERVKQKDIARVRYYMDSWLSNYLEEYKSWRYETDSLDYEIRKYLKDRQSFAEAVANSDQERTYRKVLLNG